MSQQMTLSNKVLFNMGDGQFDEKQWYERNFPEKQACVMREITMSKVWNEPGTATESVYTKVIFGTVPRLPVRRLPPGGSHGTPKILSTGATCYLFRNLKCRADILAGVNGAESGVPCPRIVDKMPNC